MGGYQNPPEQKPLIPSREPRSGFIVRVGSPRMEPLPGVYDEYFHQRVRLIRLTKITT